MHDLDINLIERILKKFTNDNSILITNIHKSPACEKGENFMSVVLRVKIEGKRCENNNLIDYKTSLIIKRPYQSEIMQIAFNSNEIFNNEVKAYNQIIPTLQTNFKISMPIAECLYADNDLIILEDLCAEGYQMRRNEVNMTVDQCLAVLQELAVFHAASLVLKHRQPDKVGNLSNQVMEIYRPDNKSIINLLDKNISVAITLLRTSEQTKSIINTIEKLENCKHKIYKRVCDLIQAKKDTNVFNHGDCWRNNILFKTSLSGLKVKLIDLQVMRFTSVAADLNYFLYINLLPEDRIKNMDLLLDSYIIALHRVMSEHSLDVDHQTYNKEWLKQEMTDFAVFGFMCSLWISPAFYYDKNDLPDLENIQPEQLDADYHYKFILKHMTPSLKDRIISLVVDFVNTYKF